MASDIDPSIPPFGNATTSGVRANFLSAKNEIEALQNFLDKIDPINEVVVNNVNDFPPIVGGKINLVPNTIYKISSQSVTTTVPIRCTGGSFSIKTETGCGSITYTGTGNMFEVVDCKFFTVDGVDLDAPNGGTLFSAIDTTPQTIFQFRNAGVISCGKFGNFSVGSFIASNSQALNTNQGATVITASNLISVSKFAMLSSNAALRMIDISTVLTTTVELENLFCFAPAGAVGLYAAANNANIVSGYRGQMTSCEFLGGSVALGGGITENDVRWSFNQVAGIPNTLERALGSFVGNALTTTIGSIGVAVPVNAVFTSNIASYFTVNSNGTITYIGETALKVSIDVSAGIQTTSGTSDVRVAIAINGTVVSTAPSVSATATKAAASIDFYGATLNYNDTVRMYVANDSGTTSLVVVSGKIRVS